MELTIVIILNYYMNTIKRLRFIVRSNKDADSYIPTQPQNAV